MLQVDGSVEGGFTVRQATADDQTAIRRLVHSARINPMGLNWQRFLLAVAPSGLIIGCGQIKNHRHQVKELASIVVRREYRGRGVAGTIIKLLLANQESPVWLTCNSFLVPFYERFGFRQVDKTTDMPGRFRLAFKIFNLLAPLWRTGTRLAVMVREGDRAADFEPAITSRQ